MEIFETYRFAFRPWSHKESVCAGPVINSSCGSDPVIDPVIVFNDRRSDHCRAAVVAADGPAADGTQPKGRAEYAPPCAHRKPAPSTTQRRPMSTATTPITQRQSTPSLRTPQAQVEPSASLPSTHATTWATPSKHQLYPDSIANFKRLRGRGATQTICSVAPCKR